MKHEFDLQQLAHIPDPFTAPPRAPLSPPSLPRGSSLSRTEVRTRRIIALVGALIYEGAVVASLETHPAMNLLPAGVIALGIAIPLIAAAVAMRAVSDSGRLGLGPNADRIVGWTMGAPVLFALGTWLSGQSGGGDPLFWEHAVGCMKTSAIFAIGPLVLGVWSLRNAFIAASTLRSAALGAACGALGAATIALLCPVRAVDHILVGHGAMILAMAALTTLVARRLRA